MTTLSLPAHPAIASSINTEVPIQGMTCAACVVRVETALRRVDGVRDATVNLVSKRASVTYDGDAIGVDAIEAAIRGAGYEVPSSAPAAEEGDARSVTERRADAVELAEEQEQRSIRRDFAIAAGAEEGTS